MFFQSFLESLKTFFRIKGFQKGALPTFTKVGRGLGQRPIYNQKYFFLKEKKQKSFCRNPFSLKKEKEGFC